MSRRDNRARLTTGKETGWWDDHGQPAPWPEDFFDDHSDWHPAESEDHTGPETF